MGFKACTKCFKVFKHTAASGGTKTLKVHFENHARDIGGTTSQPFISDLFKLASNISSISVNDKKKISTATAICVAKDCRPFRFTNGEGFLFF